MNVLAHGGWLILASVLFFSGCGTGAAPTSDATHAEGAVDAHAGESPAHGGWWCNEHGVPEEVCALCDSKLAAEFQKKGDWCTMHERPDSQCFACHPELEAQFAARYEAKYGKKPPKPEG